MALQRVEFVAIQARDKLETDPGRRLSQIGLEIRQPGEAAVDRHADPHDVMHVAAEPRGHAFGTVEVGQDSLGGLKDAFASGRQPHPVAGPREERQAQLGLGLVDPARDR